MKLGRVLLVLLVPLLLATAAVLPFAAPSSAATGSVTTTTLPVHPTSESFIAVDPVGHHVFVTGDQGTSSIFVLDYSGHLVKTITGEDGAAGMAVDPATHTLYVALWGADSIAKINTTTLTETGRFSTLPQGKPYDLVLAGGKLWFATINYLYGGVASVNLDGSDVTQEFAPGSGAAQYLAATADGTLLAVADHEVEPPGIAVYNVSGPTPTYVGSPNYPNSDTPAEVRDLTFDPSGDSLLLATGYPYYLQQDSTSTFQPTASYPTGQYPDAVAVRADGKYVAAGNTSKVFIYPWGVTTPVQTFDVAPLEHSLAFSPDGSRVFALSNGFDGSLVFDVMVAPGLSKLPTITSFSPSSGTAGKAVRIVGENFTHGTHVKFGSIAAATKVLSATKVSAKVPAAAATGRISVTTPAGTATSFVAFNVLPKITSFSPSGGAVGATVTIKGTGFTGATAVYFGSTPADIGSAVVSATSIKVTVPAGAVTGKISVTTAGGTAHSKTAFTVAH